LWEQGGAWCNQRKAPARWAELTRVWSSGSSRNNFCTGCRSGPTPRKPQIAHSLYLQQRMTSLKIMRQPKVNVRWNKEERIIAIFSQ
jgi:hypothetical protein